MSAIGRQGGWREGVICLLLFAAVVTYLHALPRNLNEADEAYFLFESKSIMRGEVLYRDVFWFAMPLAHWLMALVFAIFGVTIDVARMAFAVLHALTAVGLYLVCRRLDVRHEIAVTPAVAHLALCQSSWPIASPHWVSTFFMVLILFVVLGRRWVTSPSRALLVGMLTAGLASVHQQKGAAFALALFLFFVLDHYLRRRFGTETDIRILFRRLRFYVAGIAIIMVPLLGALVALAGLPTLWDQVIMHPLTGYRRHNFSRWAGVNFMTLRGTAYTYVSVLKQLPWVLAIGGLRLLRAWRARTDLQTASDILALSILCGAGVLSIGYLPDYIHVSFIAPLFLVFWAETIEAALRASARFLPYPRLWSAALALGVLAPLCMRLHDNVGLAQREYPFSLETAFGRIDLSNDKQVPLINAVVAAVDSDPTRRLFTYPIYASLYLIADADNPARQQFLLPGFHSAKHFADTFQRVRLSKVAHIVACDQPIAPGDPIRKHIYNYYDEIAAGPGAADGFFTCRLYRRARDTKRPPDNG